ncbi:hypothetical protein [Aurantiacibacter sp. D1-12]|uniref:hypothetical protein n=1 Tax=Aurantiacibacter sp. D1-12 TaxID=2993658 RepID=UPI00237D0EB9|nr:hypothetical protein [Aurantiacibacter sp. D1-12]MDE1466959.1 hypothetical protein [Aurantiacibacter sp. D1-12]
MAVDPRAFQKNRDAEAAPSIPLGGSRAERVQRLQIGLAGIVAVVLMIGLADIVITRAQLAEDMTVPDAAPTVEPTETATPRDPLSDVGVVPEVPAEQVDENTSSPEPEPTEDLPPANAQLQ